MLTLYHNDMSLCAQKVRVGLAEKGLPWEDKHLVLRAAEHQQPWYLKLNRRAVVPTLVHDGHVVTESNVILEYLEDAFPQPRLRPNNPYDRSKMRLWIKQLDEDVQGCLRGDPQFRDRFSSSISRARRARKAMLERIPNIFKRERRRDVIEKGTGSQHFIIAVQRMLQLLDEMEEALTEHRWLGCEEYTLADVAFTPYLARLEHLNVFGMVHDRKRVAEWYARCKARPSFQAGVKRWENPSYIELMTRRGAEHWPQVQSIMAGLKSAA